jgi:hypothetical protein
LGFNKFATSSSSNVASTSKIMFVKPKIKDVVIENSCLPKETSEDVTKKSKLKFKVPVRTNLNSKFISTCYHCGVMGHTCPNCFQIRAKQPWSQQNIPRKDEPRIRNQLKVLIAQVKLISEKLATLSNFADIKDMSNLTDNHVKITPQKEQVWVKKKDHQCLVVHTALSVLNLCLWYLDSGCSKHMTSDKSLFKELKKGRGGGNITYRDGRKSKVIGQGIVEILDAPTPQEVLYVEGLKENLLSITQFCDHDLVVQFSKKECNIFNSQGKWLMGGEHTTHNCYYLSLNSQINCNKVTLDTRELWHQRLGHLNFHDLVKASKMEAIVDLPKIH